MRTFRAGGLLSLTSFLTRPLLADEWTRKRNSNSAVPIPGKTPALEKHVSQLTDSESDPNIPIFSKHFVGDGNLVVTLMATPDDMEKTPNETIVHFEERPSVLLEVMRSWYYLGENTGWEFVCSRASVRKQNSTKHFTAKETWRKPLGVAHLPSQAVAELRLSCQFQRFFS
jgi:hypothetical protein